MVAPTGRSSSRCSTCIRRRGPLPAVVESGSGAFVTTSTASLEILPASPLLLTAGTQSFAVTIPNESVLARIESTQAEWLTPSAELPQFGAPLGAYLLPASGRFAERASLGTGLSYFEERVHVLSRGADTHYLLVPPVTSEVDFDVELSLARTSALGPFIDTLAPAAPRGLFHVRGLAGESLGVSISDGGPASQCGVDFAAAVTVVASDGSVVFFDDESLCPGTYAPCGPPGNFCLADPLEITLPEDGGYFVVVEPSINYGSPPAFTYAASITVTP
jgi:hypothetical protein